jgi:hypothetical protein
MKSKLLIFIIFSLPFKVFCQDTLKSSVDTLNIGVTSYPYAYNFKLSEGSIAIGPTLLLNSNRVALQLSIMADLKKYKTYQSTHFNTTVEENVSFFFPVLIHYNYFRYNKLNCFGTVGFILGGKYYLDSDNITRTTNGINFIIGTGISYKIFKQLHCRLSATIRYCQKIYFPGLFFDLTVPIKFTHTKN